MLLCSGKMGYDLAKARAEAEGTSIKTAVIRIEVLYALLSVMGSLICTVGFCPQSLKFEK